MISAIEKALQVNVDEHAHRFVYLYFDAEQKIFIADLEMPDAMECLSGEGATPMHALADLEVEVRADLAEQEKLAHPLVEAMPQTEDEIRARYAKKGAA